MSPRGARFIAVAALLLVAAARPALAEVQQAMPEPESYGLHTAAVDGVALGVGLALAESGARTQVEEPPSRFAVVGASLYLVGLAGAPAVHFAHRQNGIGVADLGLRLVLPPLGSLLGMGSYCLLTTERGNFREGCAGTGASVGLLAGAVAAAGLDAIGLARDRRTAMEREHDDSQRWYGWQLLLVDGAGLGLGLWGVGRPTKDGGQPPHDALRVGLGMYVVGFFVPPIVHFAHGHLFRGLGDFAVRALLAPTGALVGAAGYCAATGGQSACGELGAGFGLLTGVVSAALFDAAALSWEDAPAGSKRVRNDLVPSFQLVRGGAVMGALGAF